MPKPKPEPFKSTDCPNKREAVAFMKKKLLDLFSQNRSPLVEEMAETCYDALAQFIWDNNLDCETDLNDMFF